MSVCKSGKIQDDVDNCKKSPPLQVCQIYFIFTIKKRTKTLIIKSYGIFISDLGSYSLLCFFIFYFIKLLSREAVVVVVNMIKVPRSTAMTIYFCYALLFVFGQVRDFFHNLIDWWKCSNLQVHHMLLFFVFVIRFLFFSKYA